MFVAAVPFPLSITYFPSGRWNECPPNSTEPVARFGPEENELVDGS